MLLQIRENVYLGDQEAYKSLTDLEAKGITSVIVVAEEVQVTLSDAVEEVYKNKIKFCCLPIRSDRMNPSYVKDLAVHVPKYLTQNGETVLIQSVTGLQRGAFVVSRLICELEQSNIYEVMLELKEILPEYDINNSYF